MHDLIEHNDYAARTPAGDLGPIRRAWRSAFPFVVVGALWEVVAHLAVFPAQFFPPLETIAGTFARLTLNGVLPHHAFDTLVRLGLGFALASSSAFRSASLWGARDAPRIFCCRS